MNAEIKQQWVEALRSGEYKQGKDYLRRDGEYCCLGVLCDLHAQATGYRWDQNTRSNTYRNADLYAPDEVLDWAGLTDQQGRVLATLNDGNANFNAIAFAIEKLF